MQKKNLWMQTQADSLLQYPLLQVKWDLIPPGYRAIIPDCKDIMRANSIVEGYMYRHELRPGFQMAVTYASETLEEVAFACQFLPGKTQLDFDWAALYSMYGYRGKDVKGRRGASRQTIGLWWLWNVFTGSDGTIFQELGMKTTLGDLFRHYLTWMRDYTDRYDERVKWEKEFQDVITEVWRRVGSTIAILTPSSAKRVGSVSVAGFVAEENFLHHVTDVQFADTDSIAAVTEGWVYSLHYDILEKYTNGFIRPDEEEDYDDE